MGFSVSVARVALVVLGLSLPAFAVVEPAAPAQDREWPAVLESLRGEWVGEGTLFGAPAAFTMQWTGALNDRFMRLRFTNAMLRGGDMTPVLEAEAFYSMAPDGTLVASWFDTRGMLISIAARIEGNQLISEWSAPEEAGRTVYRVVDANTIEVTDFVKNADGYNEFGKATYTRAPR